MGSSGASSTGNNGRRHRVAGPKDPRSGCLRPYRQPVLSSILMVEGPTEPSGPLGGTIVTASTAPAEIPVQPDNPAVLTLDTTVTDALATLFATGRRGAVVEQHGHPIGVITMEALRGSHGTTPRPDTRIGDVMDWECVHNEPGADARLTLQAYSEAAWTSLRRRQLAPLGSRTRWGA